jgi:ketosteroid isomerase-like protein
MLTVTLLLLLTLAGPVAADERDEDRKALRAIAKTFEESVRQRDLSRFQATLDPSFVGVMVTSEFVDRNSIRNFWDWAWGLIGPKGTWTIEITPKPAVFYGDIAFAHGTGIDHIVTEKGREWRLVWNWTAVFKKTGNGWKLVAGHGSMDPLRNVFVKAEEMWAKVLFGGGGLVVGLIVGGGAALLLRQRRGAASA